MPCGWLSPRGRLLSGLGLGVLSFAVPPELVDEAVGDGLAWEMRVRSLPARLSVYFTLGLCLFSGEAYGQVMRSMAAGLEAALGAAGWAFPSSTALTMARRRVGEKPLESLFRRLCSGLSPGTAPWSHLGGLLVVAWDGTSLAVPDSPANAVAFGRPGAGKRRPAAREREPGAQFPQARLVALVACGTRALLGAAAGPVRGKGSGETSLARDLLACLREGMLLLADKGFYSYRLWAAAAGTGADLLWRVRDDLLLPPARALPDGSWLARVTDPAAAGARQRKNRKRRARGSALPPEDGPLPSVTVRVIEFFLTVTAGDGTARTERYRLVTSLTDHRAFPAQALASCYARRWACETAFAELKTCLRGPGRVLRSRTPDLARQEIWAFLAVYQAVRVIAARAAAGAGIDPGRVSFTAVLRAARRTVTSGRGTAAALAGLEAEVTAPRALVPERPGRTSVRAVKQPRSNFPRKRAPAGTPTTGHTRYTVTITPPPTTTQQPRQPPSHPASPP
jgi:hypothetical protein